MHSHASAIGGSTWNPQVLRQLHCADVRPGELVHSDGEPAAASALGLLAGPEEKASLIGDSHGLRCGAGEMENNICAAEEPGCWPGLASEQRVWLRQGAEIVRGPPTPGSSLGHHRFLWASKLYYLCYFWLLRWKLCLYTGLRVQYLRLDFILR